MQRTLVSIAALTIPMLLGPSSLLADDGQSDGFYRYPSIGSGSIIFVSEGDLWKVAASGGTAIRLTAHEGTERFPKASPDGRWIAFTAQYEGNDDVYVMAASGGEPRRLTVHPGTDGTIGWTADGRILFRSTRDHPHGDDRIYTVDPAGGIPELIPLEPAAWISFEPGGDRIATQKMALEFHTWKRYKGGEAEQIYVGTLDPLSFTEVTDYDGKDAFPMWADDGRIYFATDRWGRPNLASMKPDGSDVQRLTFFDDYDVRWPSMGDGRIVYQHKMDIWSFDLASGRNEMVPIDLPSDRLQVRDRFVDPVQYLGSWGLSRDGARIVLETRGDLFTTRTRKKGLIRRITDSSLARTKLPAFSPDGKWIAAWTEVDGEEQLLLHSSDNSEPPRQIGQTPPGWHHDPRWSPDAEKLAWGDETYRLFVADATSGEREVVDKASWEITQHVWSPDGRYLAYTARLDSGFNQVRIWDSRTEEVHAVSNPMFNSFAPAWGRKGKHFYFLADRYINPRLDRFEARFIVDEATLPYVVALQADGSLPFAPLSDAPRDDDDKKVDEDAGGKGKKKEPERMEPIRIDFEGMGDRLVQVPVAPGNYRSLSAVEGKLHWLKAENRGMLAPPEEAGGRPRGSDLQTYDIDKEKLSTVASGVLGYRVSMDGEVLVYRTKNEFIRIEAGATEAPKDEALKRARINLSGWSLDVNPREEWGQMLREAWRLQRDFFYDPDMHGVDWDGVWSQYGALAERLSTRDDLHDLIGEMLGELNAGHAYVWGGDRRQGKQVGTGLLAADLDYDDATGFWRIDKIYRGDYPTQGWSSPLARADLRVREGMWLVAIDGKALKKGENYLGRLANRAGQEVELSINDAPRLEGARRIVVATVANDRRIRYATWVTEMREYVDRQSGGRIGYIHLYNMGGRGLKQFARDYPPQWRKQGLIIDDRWNGGGFVAPMILAHLDRKILSVGGTRYAGPSTDPALAFHGHMAALINRQGGSDCETFAQGFKDFSLGPVIGTRTWGGWIGIRGDKPFRDGGSTTQPEFGGYDPLGKTWMIEGHGVDPDVLLDLGPDGLIHGEDVQLDYAIDDLMKRIAEDPPGLAPPPPIPPRPLVP
ncbi:MAG: PDZ domain-containing protein, partial [Acidobacteriota bacterium]